MFDDEDEYFDREPEPEPLLVYAAGVVGGAILLAIAIWWL